MKNLSLSLRLVILFTLISSTVWAICGIVAFHETKETINEFFDTYQMSLARKFATVDWKTSSNKQALNYNALNGDEDDDAVGFAVFDKKGKVLFHDGENGKYFKFNQNIDQFSDENILTGDEWRIIRIASNDDSYIITVGQELEYREDLAFDIVEEFMFPWIIGFVTLLIAIIILTFIEFRPLKRITANIAMRRINDFSAINTQNAPSEIVPLLKAMNQMLNKIDTLLKRERCFIADAAHELRTPLTALKIQLELAQMATSDTDMQQKALENLEIGLDRASHLVEQLLVLSRIEADNTQYDNQNILQWNEIIDQILSEYSSNIENKKLKITFEVTNNPLIKKGNNILISVMLRNLIDNAIKYSPQKAEISILIKNTFIKVINSNTIVDEKILKRISERFFRPAGQKEKGSGLGLAIVERIAEIYDCKVNFMNTDNSFVVMITNKTA